MYGSSHLGDGKTKPEPSKPNNKNKITKTQYVFYYKTVTMFCVGIMFGFILTLAVVISIKDYPSVLDKAVAVTACKTHHGVDDITRLGDVICKDGAKPKLFNINNEEVYSFRKQIEDKTFLNYTFIDWTEEVEH